MGPFDGWVGDYVHDTKELRVLSSRTDPEWLSLLPCALYFVATVPRIRAVTGNAEGHRGRAGSDPPETDEPTRPGARLALGVGRRVSPPNICHARPLRR